MGQSPPQPHAGLPKVLVPLPCGSACLGHLWGWSKAQPSPKQAGGGGRGCGTHWPHSEDMGQWAPGPWGPRDRVDSLTPPGGSSAKLAMWASLWPRPVGSRPDPYDLLGMLWTEAVACGVWTGTEVRQEGLLILPDLGAGRDLEGFQRVEPRTSAVGRGWGHAGRQPAREDCSVPRRVPVPGRPAGSFFSAGPPAAAAWASEGASGGCHSSRPVRSCFAPRTATDSPPCTRHL